MISCLFISFITVLHLGQSSNGMGYLLSRPSVAGQHQYMKLLLHYITPTKDQEEHGISLGMARSSLYASRRVRSSMVSLYFPPASRTPKPLLTAGGVLRAAKVGSGYQDCIFAARHRCFLSLTAGANQLALCRRKDVCTALTLPGIHRYG
jgi:hypothetical protein